MHAATKDARRVRKQRKRPRYVEKKDPGTPETRAKLRPDTLFLLKSQGIITDEQFDAAREIEGVYSAILRGLFTAANAIDSETRPPKKRSGGRDFITKMSKSELWLYETRYKQWANQAGPDAEVVIDVAYENGPCATPARQATLRRVLDMYIGIARS